MDRVVCTVLNLRMARPEGHAQRATLCLARGDEESLLASHKTRPFLHSLEAEYLDGLQASLRRQSYLMGRFCAKNALAQQMGLERAERILVEPGVFGQPLVRAPSHAGVGVTLSHSADYGCALAFDCMHPAGIDMEYPGPRHQRTLSPELSDEERARLEQAWRHPGAHTWLWTVKEAISKALHTGLTVPVRFYEVKECERVGVFLMATFSHFPQYKALSFLWQGMLVSIALPRRTQLAMPACPEISPISLA